MKHLWVWGWVACLLVCGWTGCGKAAAPPSKVDCVCFLNEHPCESSRRLEAWTKEALEAAYPAELKNGRLSFRSVNYDRKEDTHFLKDYKLPFQSIVLLDAGDSKRWVRLDKLWEMIGDQEQFRKYVQEQTGKFLSGH